MTCIVNTIDPFVNYVKELIEYLSNNQMLIILRCLEEAEMIDLMGGFKGREEMLDYLRFLFRNEKELIEDGWFSASEFFEEVYSTVVVLAEELNKE